MIDPDRIGRAWISLEDLLELLIDDDQTARLGAKSAEDRDWLEGQTLARMTLLHCGFSNLVPVQLWHPMAEQCRTLDRLDPLVAAAASAELGGGHGGFHVERCFDVLKGRTVKWRRADAVRLLREHGERVPTPLLEPEVGPPSDSTACHVPTLTPTAARPVPRTEFRQQQVLSALVACGYTPTCLPKYRNGRPSPAKAAARELLQSTVPGLTVDVFDKAWQGLRDQKLIGEEL